MSPAPSIRLARPNDLPSVLSISNDAAKETAANFAVEPEPLSEWQASFAQTHATHPWLVADDGQGVVGFAKATPWKGRCAYQYAVEVTVYVRPDSHGRGIGRALYSRLFELLRAQGYHTAIAGITLPNPASVRLHEAFGMRRVATFERIGWKFGRWHDVGYWQVELSDPAAGRPALRPVAEVA